ncbi:PQQ-binding-like beta-propeller repeat protein [Streptomyces sp. NPDC005393]|uniref:serine/threonine-protein kinase n=1 Tax=Streptomyces sp. NPDC005393 TaxID=3157041 RepID=UPI0033AA83EE
MPLSTGDPESIGGYVLIDRLGSGGMGVVYLGRSASGRQVAVKIVHEMFAQDEEFRTRFRQEIAAARRVSGAFTAPVVDADPDAERPWMATLYVPGHTLSQVVRKEGPFSGRELRTLGLGLVEALRDIHQVGVVHRDLKPANILMAEDGPRVIDFGISRAADNQTLTLTLGRLLGTPPFMSPEQLRAPREVTAASDVFSLGSLLVYAARGTGPFDADSPYLSGYQVMNEPPTLDGVPEPLRGIAERCLDKDPAARPGLDELHRMLRALPDFAATVPPSSEGPPESASPGEDGIPGEDGLPGGGGTGTSSRPGTGRGRRGRLILTGVGAALAVSGLSIAATVLAPGSSAPPDASTASATGRSRPVSLPERWRPWRAALRYDSQDPPLDYGESGCVSDGSALYCGGSGFTVAKVDAATGRVRWRTGTRPQSARPIGVRDGVVYVYEEPTDESRRVVALDADTTKRRWAREISVSEPAYLFNGGLLTLSPRHTRISAYGRSGQLLWQSPKRDGAVCYLKVLGGAPYSMCSPPEADGDPMAEGPYTLLRLDPSDGTQRELATLPRKTLSLGVIDGQPLFLAPQTAKDVYEAGYERPYNALLRVDPRTGEIRRTPLRRPAHGSATLLDGVVYFARANGTVTAISADSGKQVWQRATDTESLSAPVESRKYGQVYFSNRFGRLLALDRDTGAEKWRTAALNDAGSAAEGTTPSVQLVKDAIVAMAGDTAFSVRPDRPTDRPTALPSASRTRAVSGSGAP